MSKSDTRPFTLVLYGRCFCITPTVQNANGDFTDYDYHSDAMHRYYAGDNSNRVYWTTYEVDVNGNRSILWRTLNLENIINSFLEKYGVIIPDHKDRQDVVIAGIFGRPAIYSLQQPKR